MTKYVVKGSVREYQGDQRGYRIKWLGGSGKESLGYWTDLREKVTPGPKEEVEARAEAVKKSSLKFHTLHVEVVTEAEMNSTHGGWEAC